MEDSEGAPWSQIGTEPSWINGSRPVEWTQTNAFTSSAFYPDGRIVDAQLVAVELPQLGVEDRFAPAAALPQAFPRRTYRSPKVSQRANPSRMALVSSTGDGRSATTTRSGSSS
jgi:hypothetical protein